MSQEIISSAYKIIIHNYHPPHINTTSQFGRLAVPPCPPPLQFLIPNNKMNLLKDYLLKSSAPKQPIVPNKSSKRTPSDYEYFNFQYRKRSTSLLDMYTAKLNQLPHQLPHRKKQKSTPHFLTPIEAVNSYRIEKTIDSLNQYNEQLQLTLVNQYKHHRPHRKKSIEPFTLPSEISAYETVKDFLGKDSKNIRHEKTLGETFLKNGAKTPQQGLGLLAEKLPIVERIDHHHNLTKYESQFKGKIYAREEKGFTHTKIRFHPQKTKDRELSIKSRERSEIKPWNMLEEEQFD